MKEAYYLIPMYDIGLCLANNGMMTKTELRRKWRSITNKDNWGLFDDALDIMLTMRRIELVGLYRNKYRINPIRATV